MLKKITNMYDGGYIERALVKIAFSMSGSMFFLLLFILKKN